MGALRNVKRELNQTASICYHNFNVNKTLYIIIEK